MATVRNLSPTKVKIIVVGDNDGSDLNYDVLQETVVSWSTGF
jgi:hypothetical protein